MMKGSRLLMSGKASNKHKRRKLLFFIIILCALCALTIKLINQKNIMKTQQEQIDKIEDECARLEKEYNELLETVEDKTTLEYAGKYMRSQFGMVADDEIRINVVEAE